MPLITKEFQVGYCTLGSWAAKLSLFFFARSFELQYLNKVWLANRSTAWLLALNVVLVTLVSLVFVEHFPSPTNALEVFYQLCLLPSIWGLYAFLVLFLLVPLNFIPRFRYVSMLLVAYLGGSLAIMVYIDNYIYEIYNYHINWFFI